MNEEDEMAEESKVLPEPEPEDRAKAAILAAAEETYGRRRQSESIPEEELSEREPVDLNVATEDELSQLPGIGRVLAGRIVAYREAHGPFSEPAQITAVQGISEAFYAALADRIVAGAPEAELAPAEAEVEAAAPEEAPVEEEAVAEAGVPEGEAPEEWVSEEPVEAPEEEVAAEIAAAEIAAAEAAAEPAADAAAEAAEAWEVPVPEPQEELPAPEGLEAAEEGRVLPEPEVEAAPPGPPPELPKHRVVVEHRESGGWGRLLFMSLLAVLAGAALALLILYAANGTLSFRAAANRALSGTVSRLEAGIEAARIQLDQVQGRLDEVDNLRTRLNEAEGNIGNLGSSLETLQSDLQGVNQGLDDIRQTLNGLSDDLVSLAESVTGLDDQVGAIDGRLATVEDDLATVEQQLDAVREAAQRFDSFLAGLRDLLNEAEGLPAGSQPSAPTPTAFETMTPIPSPTAQPEMTVIPLATPVPSPTPTPSG